MTTGISALLDPYVPVSDVRGRHEIYVHAPAALVMDVAQHFPMESIWVIRTLFACARGFWENVRRKPATERDLWSN